MEEDTLRLIGYGDEAYVCISWFWCGYLDVPRGNKPNPQELLVVEDVSSNLTSATHRYSAAKLSERYNGRGDAGTGGPKLE